MNYSTGTFTSMTGNYRKQSEIRRNRILERHFSIRELRFNCIMVSAYAGIFLAYLYRFAGPPC